MEIPKDIKKALGDLELLLTLYQSVLNMATELLEEHAPHTIQLFETVLGTLEKKIRDIQEINAELEQISEPIQKTRRK
jgi:hypothetical protein